MSFKDRQRPGSFKGVPFATPSDQHEGGVDGVVFKFPGSPNYFAQELGEKPDRFTLTVFTIGPDYDLNRDDLIKALKSGPGRLITRRWGEFDAQLEPGKTYTVSHTQEETGKATFTIPFLRVSATLPSVVSVDTAGTTQFAASDAQAQATTSFGSKFDAIGPEYVRGEILGTIQRANAKLRNINNDVAGALAFPNILASNITTLANTAATSVAAPSRYGDLAAGIYSVHQAIFGGIETLAKAQLQVARAYGLFGPEAAEASAQGRKLAQVLRSAQASAMLIGTDPDEPTYGTASTREQQLATNQAAIVQLHRQAATIEAARVCVSIPYDSRDAAIAMRDQLVAALILIMQDPATDDDMYSALQDVRVAMSNHLVSTAGGLPQLIPFTPLTTLPALLLAQRIYGDARRHDELISRNNIRHPGFVPGGAPLQVLADA